MPLGWRACKVLYSSSGSLIHHQPRTIAGKETYALYNTLKIRKTQTLLVFFTENTTRNHHDIYSMFPVNLRTLNVSSGES